MKAESAIDVLIYIGALFIGGWLLGRVFGPLVMHAHRSGARRAGAILLWLVSIALAWSYSVHALFARFCPSFREGILQ